MDIDSRNVLFYSAPDDDHHNALRNSSENLDEQNDLLLRTIFWQFPARYNIRRAPDIHDEGRRKSGELKIPTGDWLAWKFYKEAYCEPALRKDTAGVPIKIDSFVRLISSPGIHTDRNKIMFLQGDVGAGKTAFLNYLISKFGPKLFRDREVWFLRYNVDVQNQGDDDISIRAFVFGLIQKLSYVLVQMTELDSELKEKFSEEIGNEIRFLNKISETEALAELQDAFRKTVSKISRLTGKRFLLILDNLDSFFHKDDRYLFLAGRTALSDDSVSKIHKIVSLFNETQGSLSKLNANILFVLRPESYLVLERSKEFYPGLQNSFDERKNLYRLDVPDWVEVIKRRLQLLDRYVEKIRPPSKVIQIKNSFEEFKIALNEQLNNDPHRDETSTVAALKSLCNQGMRDVLGFFYRHAHITNWMTHTATPIQFGPYIRSKPVGLMAHMLGGKCKYSQSTSSFPNIFLVNVEALDENIETFFEPGSQSPREGLAGSDHPHSYWLKYLILRYVRAFEDTPRALRPIDVLNTFGGDSGYNDLAVRMCLGSMSERNGSNLIVPEKTISNQSRLNITNISMNERGRYCCENIFFKFFYLQLIIDDWALPLPKHFANYRSDNSYAYLASGPGYGISSRRMIEEKAVLVSRFLAILETSLELEEQKYDPVFKKLGEAGIDPPDVGAIFESVKDEIIRVSRTTGSFSGNTKTDTDLLERAFSDEKSKTEGLLRQVYNLE